MCDFVVAHQDELHSTLSWEIFVLNFLFVIFFLIYVCGS